jgi:dUTP pyrophosphatase
MFNSKRKGEEAKAEMKFEKVSLSEAESDISGARSHSEGDPDDSWKVYDVEKSPLESGFVNCSVPSRSTSRSAGYDFRAPFDLYMEPGETIRIPTFVKCVGMPEDAVLLITNRSSLALDRKITLDNSVAVIDSDYSSDIWIQMTNHSKSPVKIEAGCKICQGIFVRFMTVSNDTASGSRSGGIGSTGK